MSYDRNPPAPHPLRFVEDQDPLPPRKVTLAFPTVADAVRPGPAGYVLLLRPPE